MERKGQGTIEYLVIIAIVIVIALVVVGLLLQVMNSGSGVPETQAKATWKSVEPFAIIDWGQSSDTTTLILQNNSGETRSFNSMTIGTDTADTNSGVSTVMAAGAKLTLTFQNACTSGNKYSYSKTNITIDYNTPNINNKTQTAVADIVGTC
jgi:hypothetical protein